MQFKYKVTICSIHETYFDYSYGFSIFQRLIYKNISWVDIYIE